MSIHRIVVSSLFAASLLVAACGGATDQPGDPAAPSSDPLAAPAPAAAGGASAALAASNLTIFDDALSSSWQDWSWVTHNLRNRSPTSAGSRSISVDFVGWSGLSFAIPAGFAATGQETLEFDINGGANVNPLIVAAAQKGGAFGTVVAIAGYCAGGTVPTNAFTHCKIPLSALQVSNATLQRIAIEEGAGRTLSRLYVDQLALVVPAALPAIQGLVANPPSIAYAASSSLVATFNNGAGSIDQAVGPVVSGAPVVVKPVSTTVYTLTVSDGLGHSVSAAVTVTVAPPPVATVTLSPATATVVAAGTLQLAATLRDASNNLLAGRAVTWASSAPAVAAVDASGLVTGVAAGSATVTATSEGKSGAAALTVVLPVSSLVIFSDALSPSWQDWSWVTHDLANAAPVSGGTRSISVDFSPWSGLSFDLPAGLSATGQETLEFDINGGANVGASINAAAQKAGAFGPAVGIAAYCAAGRIPANAFTHCKIPLAALQVSNTTLERIALEEAAGLTLSRLYVDELAVVPASLLPAIQAFQANPASIASGASSSLVATFSNGTGSIDHSVGPVLSQTGVAVAPGVTTTYTLTVSDLAGHSASALVTVSVSAPPVASVTVAPTTAGVGVGATVQLAATSRDANNNVLTGVPVVWSSAAVAVASVAASGLATGVAPGTTTITATAGGKSGTASVTVAPAPVATVAISPAAPSVSITQTLQLAAVLRDASGNLLTGRSVTWGSSAPAVASIDASGLVTGVASGNTTVTATSEGKSGTAVLTVTTSASAVATVAVSPSAVSVIAGRRARLAATLRDTAGTVLTGRAIAWTSSATSIATVDPAGVVTGVGAGSAVITATSEGVSGSTGIAVFLSPLTADRATVWDPGLNSVGGIPNRTTIFQTLAPSGGDDTATINNALAGCPANQVVLLTAGTFKISGQGVNVVKSNITLRGAGPALTRIIRTDADTAVYSNILVGPRYGPDKFGSTTSLTSDAVKGAYSLTVTSTAGFTVGDLVHLDELNDSSRVWLSEAANAWFSRLNRNTSQRMEIASIAGSTITFSTPFHIPFRVAQGAQISGFSADKLPIRWSGVEDLYTYGGQGGDGGGNVLIVNGMYSWMRNVETERSGGAGAGLTGCFRCVIRDSYIHTAQKVAPASAEYMFQLDWGSADNLIENNIAWDAGKLIVARASGGGNVIGYNYMDDAFIFYDPAFVESGLNASHQATPHMELFEGNQSFNFDSDITHGNSIYIVAFRNHLTGLRRAAVTSYDNHDGTGSHAIALTDGFPRACVRTSAHDWWFSFVGNVLGYSGMPLGLQTSWIYDASGATASDGAIAKIWMLGNGGGNHWADPADPSVVSTTVRHGNFDYFTNAIAWDPSNANHVLPPSLYLNSKPAFMGSNPWPWVTPESAPNALATLPARVRFDAGH